MSHLSLLVTQSKHAATFTLLLKYCMQFKSYEGEKITMHGEHMEQLLNMVWKNLVVYLPFNI